MQLFFSYIHLNQRCVTKEHCLSLINHQSETSKNNATFVTFNGSCVQNCPAGYDYTTDRTGCEQCEKGKCRKVCEGLNIDNIEAALNLKDCTFINGSLEISIKHGNHRVLAKALEESLSSIEEIEGYLKIARCFPLVNLKFFDKLEIIHGHGTLENGKYSLIVLENHNLQELWNISSNFKILNGRIFFHYNPKLCFFYIENLILIINFTSINDFEVSQVSNGDKFACNITDIDLKFELVTSNSVVISINIPNPTNDYNNLGRYVLYYTEAAGRNLNPYEEVYGCGDDNWKVRDVLVDYDRANQQASTVQPSLKPFTRYAFYVKTYTTQTIGGLSPIYYIHTLPSRPSEVVVNMYYSNTSSTIVLQWEPPKYHNGILTEYIVSGFWQQDDRAILDQRNYCKYPLEEETVETFPPDFQTNIQYEKKTCCSENLMIYRTHGEFGRLCENLGLGKLSFIGENDQNHISSCTTYLYDYVDESNCMLNISGKYENRNTSEDNIMNPEHNEKSHRPIHNKSFAHNLQTGRSKRGNLKDKFYQIVKNDTKTFVIDNLYHFAKYTIFVRACRKTHRSENYDDYDRRCSKSEILTIRTLKDPQADLIDESLLAYKVLEEKGIQMVQISWAEPANPNGLVLLFQIEHQRRDLENAKVITDCLTYLEYTENGKKFIIKGLIHGSYLFRLRAVSLAGAGPFTNAFNFEIKNISQVYFSKIFILCTIALVIVVVNISACYYVLHQRRQYCSDLDVLLSPINNELTSTPFVEDSWEVPRENVEFSKLISQGSFGKVYEGILYPLKLPCAIKTVSNRYVNKDKILDEIKVLKHAAGVHHMVQLLGVVFQSDPPLVVMELMLLGDLKSFLRSNREIPLLDLRFFRIAAQIADAMFFMEHNRFVHHDLAARNCMVHKNLTVKVGDFGLSRDLYSSDYFRKSNKELLPIRWMAPESLKDGIYTSRSDVWSYGVVLWEVATLAEQPYRGLTNEQVLRWVIGGQVLYTPVFCPHHLKTIMELCWNRSPNQRPTFRQVVSQLEQYTDDEFKCVSYYHTELSNKSTSVVAF